MTAIVSSNFRVVNANNFKEDVKNSNVYVAIGRADAWSLTTSDTTDTTPFTPNDHLDDQNNARRQFIGMQKLTSADVSHVVKRHNWTTGTVYVPWDSDDADIYDRNPCFYVLTNEFKVYKCLRNGNGAQSTVQPTHTTPTPTGSATDGYIWKYMYSITTADSEKFLTNAYMPVKTIPVTIEAFAAAAAATNQTKILLKEANLDIKVKHRVRKGDTVLGEISAIAGAELTLDGNLAASVSANDLLIIDFEDNDHASDALSVDFPQYKAQRDSLLLAEAGGIERIEIPAGQGGAGYQSNPDSIVISSDGETDAVAEPADVTISGGVITAIDIGTSTGSSNHGKNITVASITVSGGSATTDATPRAVIAPNRGHGTDPVAELGGFLVALNTQLTGTGGGDLTIGNDFRQITIIKNPRVHNSTPYAGDLATSATLNPLKALNITGGGDVDNLSADDVITGGSSGAKAFIAYVDTEGSNNKIYYYQNEKTGFKSFTTGASETITAQDGGGGASFQVNSISNSEVDSRSGEMLFLENRTPINRSATQIEDIKLILEF